MGNEDYNRGIVNYQTEPNLVDQSQILKIIDTSEIIDLIKHGLMGEYINEDGDWETTEQGPIMNRQGVNKYMMKLESLFNKNTSISNLEEDDYHRIVKKIKLDINWDLFVNHQKYDLSEDNIPYVRSLLLFPIELHLTTGKKDLQRRHVFGTKSLFNLQKMLSQKQDKGFDMFNN